ncbi:MAG: hypothetical protein R6W87_13655, partial [Halospina sp.]
FGGLVKRGSRIPEADDPVNHRLLILGGPNDNAGVIAQIAYGGSLAKLTSAGCYRFDGSGRPEHTDHNDRYA